MVRNILLASASVVAIASAAVAADLPVKARPVAPPVVDVGWTGWYAGVSIGYYSLGGKFFNPACNGECDGGRYFDAATVKEDRRGNGGVVGAQIGYNWQTGSWVFGIELDALANLGSDAQTGPGDFEGCGGAPRFTAEQRGSASLKGRVGFLATPDTLIYATGGGSWAGFRHDHFDCDLRGSNNNLYFGWTAGGGVEQRITSRANLRLEGRFTQYQNKTWFDQSDERFGLKPETWTVTLGANYKF